MNRITSAVLSSLAAILMFAFVSSAFAESKELTITGEGKCAKCALKETDKCQNAIQVTKDGKTVTYYLARNKVSKEFHENLCHESHQVTATGTAKEVDGKMEFTASKIELAK